MAHDPRPRAPQSGPILVGYDASAGGRSALDWAIAEAEVRRCAVTVLQSWHEPLVSHHTWVERWNDPVVEEREAAAALDRDVEAAAAGHPTVECTARLVSGHPADALVAAAPDHDLIVVGSRGHGGFAALALGSVAEHVAEAAPVSVVVVRGDGGSGGGIVVGVDGSVGSRRALLWSVEEGRLRSAPVRAVLAWTARPPVLAHGAEPFGAAAGDDDAQLALHRTVAEQVGATAAQGIVRDTACAPAAKALLDAAHGAQLVVVGAAIPVAGVRGRLGSVARQVLRHAPCPVVVAR